MEKKDRFIDSNLIKIRECLSEIAETPQKQEQKIVTGTEGKVSENAGLPRETERDREWRKALERRWEEFRLMRRDFTGKLSESIASIPEDIKVTERRLQELQSALEKFAALLDEVESMDDSKWNRDDFSSELGIAMRKIENVRLEYLRLSAKLAALQRESDAAESDSNKSFYHELNSLSLRQGFRLGLIFFLPVILGFMAAAFILTVAIIFSMRG